MRRVRAHVNAGHEGSFFGCMTAGRGQLCGSWPATSARNAAPARSRARLVRAECFWTACRRAQALSPLPFCKRGEARGGFWSFRSDASPRFTTPSSRPSSPLTGATGGFGWDLSVPSPLLQKGRGPGEGFLVVSSGCLATFNHPLILTFSPAEGGEGTIWAGRGMVGRIRRDGGALGARRIALGKSARHPSAIRVDADRARRVKRTLSGYISPAPIRA